MRLILRLTSAIVALSVSTLATGQPLLAIPFTIQAGPGSEDSVRFKLYRSEKPPVDRDGDGQLDDLVDPVLVLDTDQTEFYVTMPTGAVWWFALKAYYPGVDGSESAFSNFTKLDADPDLPMHPNRARVIRL